MKKIKIDVEFIESKCAEFEKMSYYELMASLMSLVYNCVLPDFKVTSLERFAYAYAISRSWIEYGCFDFEMIPKYVQEFLENQ